jgi:hypothetical protein
MRRGGAQGGCSDIARDRRPGSGSPPSGVTRANADAAPSTSPWRRRTSPMIARAVIVWLRSRAPPAAHTRPASRSPSSQRPPTMCSSARWVRQSPGKPAAMVFCSSRSISSVHSQARAKSKTSRHVITLLLGRT